MIYKPYSPEDDTHPLLELLRDKFPAFAITVEFKESSSLPDRYQATVAISVISIGQLCTADSPLYVSREVAKSDDIGLDGALERELYGAIQHLMHSIADENLVKDLERMRELLVQWDAEKVRFLGLLNAGARVIIKPPDPTDEEQAELYGLAVLSTGHLRRETAHYMDTQDPPIPERPAKTHGDLIEGGYSFRVPTVKEISEKGYFDNTGSAFVVEMPTIFDWARRHGVSYLRFDRDGPVMQSLTTYDW